VLAAQGVFAAEELREQSSWGNWDWTVASTPIRGILPATLAAQQAGFIRVKLRFSASFLVRAN
jgi:hypothetical protein